MENNLMKFNFNGKNVTTVLDGDNNPWFVAKEVCDVLGLNNVGQAVSYLDNDEKNTIIINDGIQGNPNKLIINESGLYSLILRSRKPEAKAFKKWVTAEVLPQIRKTGGYIPVNEKMSDSEIMAKALLIANKTIEQKDQLIEQHKKTIEQQKPKVEYVDRFINTDKTWTLTDAFNEYGIPPQKGMELLRRLKYLTLKNIATAKSVQKNFIINTEYEYYKGRFRTQARVTPKGMVMIGNHKDKFIEKINMMKGIDVFF